MVATKTIDFTDIFSPKPKQRQLLDTVWAGATTGDPEYLLWGGSAGPGKSWGLRVAALVFLIKCFRDLHLTGVQVGLFSVDFPRLRDRHINEIKHWPEWLGKYNEATHDFTLGSKWGSGILSLRNLDDPAKYSSAQFAAQFVEELTEIDRATFEELRTRKRWPGVPYSPFVAVTNPRLRGLYWVRKLWIEHDFSGNDASLRGHPFWFLQALPSDNDSLPPSYYQTLDSLGPVLKRQLLEGDWYVSIDQAFPDFTRWAKDLHTSTLVYTSTGELIPWHQIPSDAVNPTWRRIAGHDWGYDSPGHHLWGAVDPAGGVVIYREWSFKGLPPDDIAAGVLYRQGDERVVTYADPAIWQERRHSDLTSDQIALLSQNGRLQLSKYAQYTEAGLHVERANNARVAGKSRIHTLLKDRGDGVPYLRIMDSCPALLSCLQNITKDPDNGEDVLTEYLPDDDLRDDAYDALRYMLMGVPTRAISVEPAVPITMIRRF